MHTIPAAPTVAAPTVAEPPAAPPGLVDAPPGPTAPTDRLGAEVRESVLLLGLSVALTAGLAAAAQSLLALLS